jgi:hypothetical protein
MASATAQTGRANEDFVGAVPTAVVLIDVPVVCPVSNRSAGTACGPVCQPLGKGTSRTLVTRGGRTLPALLAEAVERVADAHRVTCDLANPSSPWATVAILRLCDGRADYLVLSDSVLVLDRAGAPLVVSDPREVRIGRPYRSALEAAAQGSAEYEQARRDGIDVLRANRNRPGGYWVDVKVALWWAEAA